MFRNKITKKFLAPVSTLLLVFLVTRCRFPDVRVTPTQPTNQETIIPLETPLDQLGAEAKITPTMLPLIEPTPLEGRIVFVSNRDGNDEVYVMNASGSQQTRLTHNQSFDGFPRWSPDGQQISFISDRDGNLEVYVMNSDGSQQTRLTNNFTYDNKPIWSPSGGQIAFVSESDGDFEIYIMNADGSQKTRLTNHLAIDTDPAWSPDGQHIVFSSTRGNREDVVFVNSTLYSTFAHIFIENSLWIVTPKKMKTGAIRQ